MLVSCVITTYKREVEIVKRAVSSALRQKGNSFKIEVIVVNDAPENTELAKQLEETFATMESVRYLAHDHNRGACAARNTGIRSSSGEVIGFLDDDDEWLDNKVELLLPFFTNERVAIVYSDYLYQNGSGEQVYMKRACDTNQRFSRILESNYIGSTSLPLLRRSAVLDVGCFDETIRSSQDHDLWIRLLEKYEAAYCPKPTIIYSFSPISITTRKGNRTAGYNQLLNKYASYYKKDKGLHHRRLLGIGRTLLRDRNYSGAVPFLLKAFALNPFAADNYQYLVKSKRR